MGSLLQPGTTMPLLDFKGWRNPSISLASSSRQVRILLIIREHLLTFQVFQFCSSATSSPKCRPISFSIILGNPRGIWDSSRPFGALSRASHLKSRAIKALSWLDFSLVSLVSFCLLLFNLLSDRINDKQKRPSFLVSSSTYRNGTRKAS